MTEEQFIEQLEKDSGIKYGDFGFVMGAETPFFPPPKGLQSSYNRPGFMVWKTEKVVINGEEAIRRLERTMHSVSEEENLKSITEFLKTPYQVYVDLQHEMDEIAKSLGWEVEQKQ